MVIAIEEVRCLVGFKRLLSLTKHLLNVYKFFNPPNQTKKIFSQGGILGPHNYSV